MKDVTDGEKGIIAIMRLNKLIGIERIKKSWRIGRVEITFDWRSKKNLWGRFGGGWNWKLGAQWSRKSYIFNLLICSLSIRIKDKS